MYLNVIRNVKPNILDSNLIEAVEVDEIYVIYGKKKEDLKTFKEK